MKSYNTGRIRNVCLIAHSKAGKTTLAEAMLYNSGVINRIGKTEDGNTVCDYDSEEIKRAVSIRTSLAAVEWKDTKMNFLDAPGYFDFVGDMISAIAAADVGVIVVSGKSGARVGGEIAFRYAEQRDLPVAFFINKMDHENAKFSEVVEELRTKFGTGAVPIQVPIKEGEKFAGYVDVVDNTAYKFENNKLVKIDVPEDLYPQVQAIKVELCEAIAESDEELLDKFFSDEPFTKEDLKRGIKEALVARTLFPILCGSALENLGIDVFLDAVDNYFPSPLEVKPTVASEDGKEIQLGGDKEQPAAGIVFKTIVDPFVGRLSLIRLYTGALKGGATMYNSVTGTSEKIGQVLTMRGKEKIELDGIFAGDICAVAKLTDTHTGDTLCTPGKNIVIPAMEFPRSVYSMAVVPKTRGDEEKISSGLAKLGEEDPTITKENNVETHQLIVSGMGEQHLEIVVNRLKGMGTEVTLSVPRVSYRETITKKIQAEGKHKKQSGGHGQYGHVKIEFEPTDSTELVFEEKIFGGSVPKNYHPAVEKGLREMMEQGIQAGYLVVGVKATLYDGSYHDVDSSEMAFKLAAHLAFKQLINAGPILLEPVGHLEVSVPDDYTGDVMGDINKRRGRVIGMEPGKIVAEVPMSEMFRYAIDLRSMTQGRGSFVLDFERYEQTPPQIAQKIIEEYKAENA